MANKVDHPTKSIAYRKPVFIGFIAFLFLLLAGFFMLWQRYQILIDDRQSEMEGIVGLVEQNIEQSLKYSYTAALSLALQIDEEGKIENFTEMASQLVDNNPNINGIEIVPDGVITKVYPYEENKEALNYNILKDSTRNEEAFKAIERKQMFFAGPFELRQGGMAIIGRLPVFIKNDFWGFVAVIIHFDNLIDQSGLNELSGDNYVFQFSKMNPVTGKEEFFLDDKVDLDNSYSTEIVLPDGEWKIYIVPVDPSKPFYTIIPVAFLILIFAGAFGWIIFITIKRPVKLQELVNEQAGELAKSELHFRTIFNQAAIGMARVDSKSGMILEANKKFQNLLGYPEADLKQMDYRVISHPDDLTENTELMQQLSRDEIREYSLEKRLERKDGNYIWVRITVSPLWEPGEEVSSHIAIVEDISARVKAKQELVENEKRFRSLVENSKEVILIIAEGGEAVYCSPALKRITGYSTLNFPGNDIYQFIHPEDIPGLKECLKKVNNNPGVPYSEIIMRLKTNHDEWIWVNATLNNLIHEKSIGGYVVNFRDITGKKEAEMNLVKSYELVMEQNKRLLNFAYIVSHNLRSHSSNMSSLLELYGTEESESERKNYIKLLHKVSKNLDQSLHDLNEVVSINNNIDIKTESIKVSDFVDKTLDVLSLQINSKKARVIKEVPEDMIIPFNSAYMESVLLNFLTNALRYSSKERRLSIGIRAYREHDKWILEIEDNGIGIDLEKYGDKVFGLYKTFSGRKDARGVGLFITKNQINAMGGTVDVESEPGLGTVFKVIFK